jgi:8-oxo-dGTP pyrophosphatase MutT (NUDIX family)
MNASALEEKTPAGDNTFRSAESPRIRYTRGMALDLATTDETPIYRPTSRLLVIDPLDRILLLRIHEPAFEVPIIWFTPGGGLDLGETHEQAAVRELWEETGIVAPLGPCVWLRRHVVRFRRDGPLMDLDERYYVVQVEEATATLANGTDWERRAVTEHRWWSLDDLGRLEELYAPRCLLEVLPPILARAYPAEPVAIGL